MSTTMPKKKKKLAADRYRPVMEYITLQSRGDEKGFASE